MQDPLGPSTLLIYPISVIMGAEIDDRRKYPNSNNKDHLHIWASYYTEVLATLQLKQTRNCYDVGVFGGACWCFLKMALTRFVAGGSCLGFA